jgi:hypothetical protein
MKSFIGSWEVNQVIRIYDLLIGTLILCIEGLKSEIKRNTTSSARKKGGLALLLSD